MIGSSGHEYSYDILYSEDSDSILICGITFDNLFFPIFIQSNFREFSWFSTYQGSRDVFIIQINASDGSLLNGYQEGSFELDQINSLALNGDSLFFAGFRFYCLIHDSHLF